jgi:hypothetical protein
MGYDSVPPNLLGSYRKSEFLRLDAAIYAEVRPPHAANMSSDLQVCQVSTILGIHAYKRTTSRQDGKGSTMLRFTAKPFGCGAEEKQKVA